MARGTLRILLGAAPGVGKTYAMLEEAHLRRAEGVDTVVAIALHHGRKDTAALIEGLEVVPSKQVVYRGASFEEMDLEAVLLRKPSLALVDEYAHTVVEEITGEAVGIPSHDHQRRKRWQDVETLLEAGIDVISTLNIQHLASLGDVVSQITNTKQSETVPDEVVRRADQIELVDISPELLRQRLSAGNIYAGEKIDAALANYFRLGNLSALRELALLWLADQVEDGLAVYRSSHGIEESWPTRERVVIGLTGGPEGEVLIRRAARILARISGGELLGVHVRAADGVRGESPRELEAQRQLLKDLGGSYHSVTGDDPAQAMLEFARSVNATQLVVGTSRRRPLARFFSGGGVGSKIVRGSGDIDVHMVSHPLGGRGVRFQRPGTLDRRRVIAGFVLAMLLPALIETALVQWVPNSFVTDTLLQLCGCVLVALIGGLWPALLGAVFSSLLLNFFSAAPTGTLTISDPENLLALLIFLAVSAAVAFVVGLAARRTKDASRAGAEAATLSELARGALVGEDSLESYLAQVREAFRISAVSLLQRSQDDRAAPLWRIEASSGEHPPSSPEQADNAEEVEDGLVLALDGRVLDGSDRRLLVAFGAHLVALRQRIALNESRRDNVRLAEGNTMRTSILRAVSHDLRTPLAAIKLSVSSLRQDEVHFEPADEAELLATIENSADRLDALVGNLLDMSRISSDAVAPQLGPVRWIDAIEAALGHEPAAEWARLDLPANMPPVEADIGMLERVIANIVENAVKYAPDSDIVLVGTVGGAGSALIDGQPASELRIVDHGRGVAAKDVVAMFRPFQRLDDVPAGTGVGLGLAVAKGFTEAMGGVLEAEQTPGGGLTMVLRLPMSAGGGRV
ncbi:two-component system sensor histidine kinase KdpD [Psychromicrobium silvestre]|uniref:histidine kinase n=1 Tax=Psychromicrobium silvestre TaxID=1645614 RepID=A0A7Y9S8H5_9MICC|nr:DUF4118 domain-containing protein [Psychromicrobium silvestre]NYE95362.1 two-component system sensor histidine kinase KdpD [Psychromicrobium silvestre]